MVDVRLDKDELYPYYSIVIYDYGTVVAELTEAEIADLERVETEWNQWQNRLSLLYHAKG